MAAWLRDLRYAARALRGNPGFSLAAVLTLAVGIGAITGVFTVVNAVLLRPFPFADSNRIVAAGTVRRDAPSRLNGVSIEELRDWQQQSKTLVSLCGWRTWGMTWYNGDKQEPVFGVIATPELFQVFPSQPVLGRLLQPEEDVPGRNRNVVLAFRYWRDRFASDPRVIGRTMELERGPKTRATYTIVGVLPPSFEEVPSFDGVKVFALSSIDPDAATGRGHRNRQVVGRLAPGASLADAQAELHAVAVRLAQRYPDANRDQDARVMPIVEREVGATAETLRTFLAAVAFVLLIACGNVAGLQLVRALGRRREFSIRQALGGSRLAVIRALTAESTLLAVVGGALGLLVAWWLVDVVLASGPAIPRTSAVRFDVRVFAFALAMCLASGVGAALPAVLMTNRLDLVRALKEESGQIARALRARTFFVSAQVALALVLLAGAVVAGQTLVKQLSARPGFDPSGVAVMQAFPEPERYRTGEAVAALYANVIREAAGVPGVRAVSAISAPPLSGEGAEPVEFTIGGETGGEPARTANTFNAAPGLFQALGVPLRAGRDLADTDTASAPLVAVVNDTFVRRFLNGRDPVGTTLRLAQDGQLVRIVGVAGDVLQDVRPRAVPEPEIYWPYAQRPRWATFLVVRADTPGVADTARRRVQAFDPNLRVNAPVQMGARLARSARGPRFMTLLFGLFAAIAVLLSGIGVAGLVFYSFAQRTRELAVRISLGATHRDVLRAVGGGAFRAVLAGSAIGVGGAIAIGRLLDATLRDLEPLGLAALATAWALLVVLGWLACYLPARRALSLDPADALRGD